MCIVEICGRAKETIETGQFLQHPMYSKMLYVNSHIVQ
jgi:hypothetical protein